MPVGGRALKARLKQLYAATIDSARSLDRGVTIVLVVSALVLLFLEYAAIRPAFLESPRRERTVERLGTWGFLCFLAYFFVPALVTRIGLRARLRDYGLSFRGIGGHLPLYLLLYLLVVPVVWIASSFGDFQNTYPFPVDAKNGLASLIRWELIYGLQFFSLEFFFRGFMLFGLEKRFGLNAVLVMIVPYCMLHFHKPWLEAAAAIGAGMILGVLALRTRSIIGGVLIHWSVAITMDVLAIMAGGGFR